MRFRNKRNRPTEIDWIQENFKDPKLRVLLYLQYGLTKCHISEEVRKKILGRFEATYEEIDIANTATKSAHMLKQELERAGYEITAKRITEIYNLAPNVLTYKKAIPIR